jgi:hypothetical protein
LGELEKVYWGKLTTRICESGKFVMGVGIGMSSSWPRPSDHPHSSHVKIHDLSCICLHKDVSDKCQLGFIIFIYLLLRSFAFQN